MYILRVVVYRGKFATWNRETPSRQDHTARAVALLGDRLEESAFKVEVDRKPLCEGEHLDALLELAEHIGIEQPFGL